MFSFGRGGRRWRADTGLGRVIVEDARPDDAAALLGVQSEVIDEGLYFITEPDELTESVASKAAVIRDLNRRPNARYFVARLEGEAVGMLLVQGGSLRRLHHNARIEIYVSARARGAGVGSALMSSCVEWATENPIITKLSLNVFAHNVRAIKLYERFGFVREGLRAREYRLANGQYLDDVLMFRMVEADGDVGSGGAFSA